MHPRSGTILLLIAICLAAGAQVRAQNECILANPSFEIGGQDGAVFGGWSQFGNIGSVGNAHHGSQAARASGPNIGDWGVSGYWQYLACEPGEQWEVTGHVRHPAGSPLTGQCTALANVEWRNEAGDLIDYDSFAVADASSPVNEFLEFNVLSAPAPAGTAWTVILLGVLQSPSDPAPEVHFDQITFHSTTPPTMDELQWNDFPGGRSLEFANRSWRVKGPGYYGPGPSNFCHTADCVWVDQAGRLHLTIRNIASVWYSTEVVLEEALGYGDYVFTTQSALDQLDVHAVLGLFLWQYGPCWDPAFFWWNPFNEIDVEFSRWGDPGNDPAQFVAQPYDWPGNINRFEASFGPDEIASHAFRWLPDRVEFRSWRGGPEDESAENMIHQWTYTGPHVPRPEQPRVHMNLWRFEVPPAGDQEVIVTDFRFLAAGATSAPELPEAIAPLDRPARLHPASPNPFNPETRIRYELLREALVELDVYDVTGARLRTLVKGLKRAGVHEITWDGRDDEGRHLASGVYLARLRVGSFIQARQMVLIK